MRHHLMALGLGALALGMVPNARAQSPTIAGIWKLNTAQSDDTQEKLQIAIRGETPAKFGAGYDRPRGATGAGSVADGSASRGGGSGGGVPRSGVPSSGAGGGGAMAGGALGPTGRIMRPAAQLEIEISDSMIVIRDGGEIPQRIYVDGRSVQEPALIGPPVELTVKWKDGKLTVERKTGPAESVKESYSIDKKTGRLVVDTKATSTTFQRPLELKRAYDRAG